MSLLAAACLFAFVAACPAATAACALLRRASEPGVADQEKFAYVSVPQTSRAALSVHRHRTGSPDREAAPR
jgi:hypothetical protein